MLCYFQNEGHNVFEYLTSDQYKQVGENGHSHSASIYTATHSCQLSRIQQDSPAFKKKIPSSREMRQMSRFFSKMVEKSSGENPLCFVIGMLLLVTFHSIRINCAYAMVLTRALLLAHLTIPLFAFEKMAVMTL